MKAKKKKGKLLDRRIDRNMDKSFSTARKVVERLDEGEMKKAKRRYRKLTKRAMKTSKLFFSFFIFRLVIYYSEFVMWNKFGSIFHNICNEL